MKPKPKLRINYGLNRRVGRKTEHRYGKLRISGEWESATTHQRIKERIMRANPGWLTTGYALIHASGGEER